MGAWIVALLLAAALLALAAVAARRRSGAGLAAAQLAALLPLAGLVMSGARRRLRPTPLAGNRRRGAAGVLPEIPSGPFADTSYLTLVRAPPPSTSERRREPLYGLRYPLAPDLDGLYSPLAAQLRLHYFQLDAKGRANWLRTLGIVAAVLEEKPDTPDLQLVSVGGRAGGTSRLYAVREPAPPVWWPHSVAVAASPGDAFRTVSRAPDPVADVVADRPLDHHPGAQARRLAETPDGFSVDVSEGGGLLVLCRAFQPLYEATAEGKALPTLPVNLSLLGVQVPPGAHRVEVGVSAWPEKLAGGVALLAFVAAAALARRRAA